MSTRTKRSQTRGLTRRRLLDAAADLFARKGFEATSVDDVAEAAGFSKGAFYYNFTSKDDLLDALVTDFIGTLSSDLEHALAAETTIESKLAAAQRLLTEHEREAHGFELELEVLVQAARDPRVRAKVAAAYAKIRSAIASLISEQFARAGVRPPLDPMALATIILAAGAGQGILQAIDPDSVQPGLLPSALALLLRPPSG
jgi:AcrR family transcriptional regulator